MANLNDYDLLLKTEVHESSISLGALAMSDPRGLEIKLHKGLTTIAGISNSSKTQLAVEIAYKNALDGKQVAYIALEEDTISIFYLLIRLEASRLGIVFPEHCHAYDAYVDQKDLITQCKNSILSKLEKAGGSFDVFDRTNINSIKKLSDVLYAPDKPYNLVIIDPVNEIENFIDMDSLYKIIKDPPSKFTSKLPIKKLETLANTYRGQGTCMLLIHRAMRNILNFQGEYVTFSKDNLGQSLLEKLSHTVIRVHAGMLERAGSNVLVKLVKPQNLIIGDGCKTLSWTPYIK